jgi:hypothetical protein
MLVTGFAYEIKRKNTGEVVFAGILRNSEDTIYPAQHEPYLLEEFPTLPYECEFHHFSVPGLYTEGFYFSTTVSHLLMWKD